MRYFIFTLLVTWLTFELGITVGCSEKEPSQSHGQSANAKTIQSVHADPVQSTNQSSSKEPMMNDQSYEKAILGAGCFWGVEYVFQQLPGIIETQVGYSGGKSEKPTYQQICNGDTGHAEVVLLYYDPKKVSYEKILDVFFKCHNPTQINQQGPDVGTQYRSVIFYMNEKQKQIAQQIKAQFEASGKFNKPIATQIAEATPFWSAEDYHQDYIKKTGHPMCHIIPDDITE